MCNCTKECGCDSKHFSSEINYDGAAVPCLDISGIIKPPYTNLNVLLELIAAKLCQLDQTAAAGNGIDNIAWISNTLGPINSPGGTDTYTITFTDTTTTTFDVYNGTNGTNGTNGDAFVLEAPAGITAGLTGVAGGTSSVSSISSSGANVSGKYYTLNINGQLNVTGNTGETLGIDIDLSAYLPSNIANTCYSAIVFDPVVTPSLFNFTSPIFGLVSGQALKVNNFPIPDNYAGELVNFFFQISFIVV